jgi:hypothetical protein
VRPNACPGQRHRQVAAQTELDWPAQFLERACASFARLMSVQGERGIPPTSNELQTEVIVPVHRHSLSAVPRRYSVPAEQVRGSICERTHTVSAAGGPYSLLWSTMGSIPLSNKRRS